MVVKLSAILLMCLGDLVLKEVVSNAYPSMNVPFFMVWGIACSYVGACFIASLCFIGWIVGKL